MNWVLEILARPIVKAALKEATNLILDRIAEAAANEIKHKRTIKQQTKGNINV